MFIHHKNHTNFTEYQYKIQAFTWVYDIHDGPTIV